MTRYAVGLGSNLGDRLGHLRAGVTGVSNLGEVTALSSLYESAPVGGPEQDPFLNAVIIVTTELAPTDLLAALQSVEHGEGRKRASRWGPRTLDLDIVASDGPDHVSAHLTIPHPESDKRRFVLEPLSEIWPDARVSGGRSAAQALASVGGQEVDILARRWATPTGPGAGRLWVAGQLAWFLAIAAAMAYDGSLPEGRAGASRLIGGLLIVFGGILAYTSMRRLGPSLTAVPEPVKQGAMVETGSYSRARHPIYGGVFLLLLGTALVVDSVIAAALSTALLGYFWLKSRYEERQLRIAYPSYAAYRKRVPRRFIPFVI